MIRQQLNFAEVTHTHTHTHTHTYVSHACTHARPGCDGFCIRSCETTRPTRLQTIHAYMLYSTFLFKTKIILWYVAGTGNRCEIFLPPMVLVCWTKC